MKKRLDKILTDRGLAESRQKAQALILAGQVIVHDQRVDKPGRMLDETVPLRLKSRLRYVSRGGDKLESVHGVLGFAIEGLNFVDIGASTGGFTDFLLQNGAQSVLCVDVGHDQLAWRIRADPRVHVLEKTHAKELKSEQVPFTPDGIVMDVSFISLQKILQVFPALFPKPHFVVPMYKPQFELGSKHVNRRGVVTDDTAVLDGLRRFHSYLEQIGYGVEHVSFSRVSGPHGNVEYFFHAVHSKTSLFFASRLSEVIQKKQGFYQKH